MAREPVLSTCRDASRPAGRWRPDPAGERIRGGSSFVRAPWESIRTIGGPGVARRHRGLGNDWRGPARSRSFRSAVSQGRTRGGDWARGALTGHFVQQLRVERFQKTVDKSHVLGRSVLAAALLLLDGMGVGLAKRVARRERVRRERRGRVPGRTTAAGDAPDVLWPVRGSARPLFEPRRSRGSGNLPRRSVASRGVRQCETSMLHAQGFLAERGLRLPLHFAFFFAQSSDVELSARQNPAGA